MKTFFHSKNITDHIYNDYYHKDPLVVSFINSKVIKLRIRQPCLGSCYSFYFLYPMFFRGHVPLLGFCTPLNIIKNSDFPKSGFLSHLAGYNFSRLVSLHIQKNKLEYGDSTARKEGHKLQDNAKPIINHAVCVKCREIKTYITMLTA